MGLAIHTPKGVIVHSGDFKIDFIPAIDRPADLGKISRIGQEGVKLYLGESTNARTPGHTPSEKIIGENIATVISRHARQRIIVSAFASNIGRIIQLIENAVRHNKVIFLAGRSMVNNVQLCQELGYINVPKEMIRLVSPDIEQLPDERVMILCTGSQGEEFSALVRMATNTFKDFILRPGDCVILSSHTIPGNEKAVGTLMNNLVDVGVELVDDPSLDLHTSGHAYQEDMKEMMALLKPEYFSPVHGESVMRQAHKKIALDMRIPEEKILLPKNGQLIELYDNVVLLSEKKLKLDTVMIDGKGQGHLSGEYVMKARGIMAEDGVVALIFKVDTKTHELVGNLQIESRGFVYSSEVKNVHTKIVEFARATYNANLKKRMEVKDNLRNVKEVLGEEITKIIGRVPMLMVMFVYINREAISNIPEVSEDDPIV
ncbi:MAG: ribonuclease J [Candidatus Peribacteria bacterium]|nr:ribonuclease J [Candidatus Peribacteria bacterium]